MQAALSAWIYQFTTDDTDERADHSCDNDAPAPLQAYLMILLVSLRPVLLSTRNLKRVTVKARYTHRNTHAPAHLRIRMAVSAATAGLAVGWERANTVVILFFATVLGGLGIACSPQQPAVQQDPRGINSPSARMPDGNTWTTTNLTIDSDGSYCYDNSDVHCRRYGRLYTWEAALAGCRALGMGWRLPTDDDWRRLASSYGGISETSADHGKGAYAALIAGGQSGFGALWGAVAMLPLVSSRALKLTASIGRLLRLMLRRRCTITSAAAAPPCTAKQMGKRTGRIPCGACGAIAKAGAQVLNPLVPQARA